MPYNFPKYVLCVDGMLVLATYLLVAGGVETSTWNVRGLAVGAMTVIVTSTWRSIAMFMILVNHSKIVCIASTKWSLRLSNTIGLVKVITLIL